MTPGVIGLPEAGATLSVADVARLSASPNGETKAELAGRIAKLYADGDRRGDERAIALDILRIFARDIEQRVREALAYQVRHCTDMPRDLALTIANDVDCVAAPFLETSPVLTDEDLIPLLRESSPEKQVAIARRPQISAALGHEIIATDNIQAVSTLSGNNGAQLTEAQFDLILDRFGYDDRVREPLVSRQSLPDSIVERLVTIVSGRLREELIARHPVSAAMAGALVDSARQRAFPALDMNSDAAREVAELHRSGRLTASVVLRAACKGNIIFVEEAMARLADLQIANAQQLIHDAGPLGLKAIYGRTGLPPSLLPIFRSAIEAIRQTPFDGDANDRERRERSIIERVLTQHHDMPREDAEFLLEELTRLSAATAGTRLKEAAMRLSASDAGAARRKAS